MANEALSTDFTLYGRLSFPHLFEPRASLSGGKASYQATLLLPPGTDITPVTAAMKNALIKKWGEDKAKWPKSRWRGNNPGHVDIIRPVEENEHFEAFHNKGWRFVAFATYNNPPAVVDHNLNKVLDKSEVYPGRWCFVGANAYWFDSGNNKGLTLGLNAVQLHKHDEPLAGRKSVDSYFQKQAIPAGGSDAGSGWGDDAPAQGAGGGDNNPFG